MTTTAAKVSDICDYLESFAPRSLAEDWDNVGLLVGSRHRDVHRVMTCLTVTPSSAKEAIDAGADLIVTHHPIPFRPLKKITDDSITGRLLLSLVESRVAVFSPHTSFDSARGGINQMWAERLDLSEIQPLLPAPKGTGDSAKSSQNDAAASPIGTGRNGVMKQPCSIEQFADRLRAFLGVDNIGIVGPHDHLVRKVGIGCGSAGTLLDAARASGCDSFITGEANFHTCLEAEATGTALFLVGHFASERFAVEQLAELLSKQFPSLKIWPSAMEQDPIRWA